LKEKLLLEPLPGGSRWAAAFGSLLLFAFLLQVVTGILLAMNYAPSDKTAWPSVKFIQEEVPLGAFVRSVHHWGSSAMVILLLVHLVQVFVWGAYKRPREFTWMVGVLLLFCTLGLAFTGYLLPWDQKAYWATKVGLGIASTTPFIGDGLKTLLQGGPEMGNLTLTRFFTLHGFLLPGLLILLVVVHLYLFRTHGVTPPWWQSSSQLKAVEEPFWPGQAWKDGVLALLFLAGLAVWCYHRPAPLEAQADPSQPYEARPEWYFMFLFQILRYFEGPYEIVGTFVLPTAFFLILFFWPFLDRNPQRNPLRRPVAMTLLGTGTLGLVGLTIFAISTDVRMHEPELVVARAPTPEPAGPIQQADVARLYNASCVACHGVDGRGAQIRAAMPTIPDFTSFAWQMSQTDLEILHRIVDGNEPLMPAYRDKHTSQQNLALAIYVRAFVNPPTAPLAPKVGPPEPALPNAKAGQPEAAPPPAVAAKPEPTPSASKTAQPVLPAPKAGPPEPTSPVAKVPPPPPVTAQMSSVQVYRAYCLACHDVDGRGNTIRKGMPEIPDLTDSKWQDSRTDAELRNSILEGKGKFMLPMKDKLGEADAKHMVAYMRAFRQGKQIVQLEPQQPPAPPPAQPAIVPGPKAPAVPQPPATVSAETAAKMRVATTLYRQYCLICHGTDGRGTEVKASMPTIPDFTNRTWQEGMTDRQLAVSILDGKGVLMVPFRDRVGDAQAQDLVAYVRAFGPPQTKGAEAAPSDYDKQFRELQEQLKAMEKQLKEVPPKKPPKP
jgi:quinol-cytochrome oxidoreductase complex cytochrome b subunit/mono/diheme cytochrome c family protein